MNHLPQTAQEHELALYVQSLGPLLDAQFARTVSAAQWAEVKAALESLQAYLLENKVLVEVVRVRSSGCAMRCGAPRRGEPERLVSGRMGTWTGGLWRDSGDGLRRLGIYAADGQQGGYDR